MGRELKKYGIRSTRKPARNPFVSTAVHVVDQDGLAGYCYISFEDAFVQAIGKALCRGVAEFDPAYVHVEFDRRTRVWRVGARYLLTSGYAQLWESVTRPVWLKSITKHEVHNGSDTQKPIRAASGNAGAGSKTGTTGSRRKTRSTAGTSASGIAVS